jgi:hypothetical protein
MTGKNIFKAGKKVFKNGGMNALSPHSAKAEFPSSPAGEGGDFWDWES